MGFQKGHTINVGKKHSVETINKISNSKIGHICSEETKEKIKNSLYGNIPWNKGIKMPDEYGESRKSVDNPNWKGGKYYRTGYVYMYKPEHPHCNYHGYVNEHRLVMEESIGRYLEPEEVVHHINMITDDNVLENLELFSNNSEHLKAHHKN